jgi:glutamate formiminotransferase
MSGMSKIIECVPNFSEGRDLDKIEKIVNPFRGKDGVKLLDYKRDEDHNRVVVTVVGEPQAVKNAVLEAMGTAIELIDMTKHIKNVSMTEAVELSKEAAKEASERFGLPIFLYEKAATDPQRENLANIRKGEFEGMVEKIKLPEWKPDYGQAEIHPTAGVTAVGARMPLVAFNVNLNTNSMDIANKIAKNVRFINGGLRYCKAIGIELKDRGIVQISMNMTDYTKTALYRAFELIRIEAARYGVTIAGSEIIGLLPMEALIDTAVYYLGVEDFSMEQILENRLME